MGPTNSRLIGVFIGRIGGLVRRLIVGFMGPTTGFIGGIFGRIFDGIMGGANQKKQAEVGHALVSTQEERLGIRVGGGHRLAKPK